MRNTVVYLLGHYGVGKLTVAKAFSALTGALLVDNHLINNVIFPFVRLDGKTPLPEPVWDAIETIRNTVFEVIEAQSPADWSFVLTNALLDIPEDRAWYERVATLARRRRAVFVPVVLDCAEDENLRRIDTPERKANMKHTDGPSALARRRTSVLLLPGHPNRLVLDTTIARPEMSAQAIVAHVEGLKTR